MNIFTLMTGKPGPSGFGSASTAEQVTEGIDASNLTALITGLFVFFLFVQLLFPCVFMSYLFWIVGIFVWYGDGFLCLDLSFTLFWSVMY